MYLKQTHSVCDQGKTYFGLIKFCCSLAMIVVRSKLNLLIIWLRISVINDPHTGLIDENDKDKFLNGLLELRKAFLEAELQGFKNCCSTYEGFLERKIKQFGREL